jgi:hypothetical protein
LVTSRFRGGREIEGVYDTLRDRFVKVIELLWNGYKANCYYEIIKTRSDLGLVYFIFQSQTPASQGSNPCSPVQNKEGFAKFIDYPISRECCSYLESFPAKICTC